MKSILLFNLLFASGHRVESLTYNRGEVLSINMVSGLVSKVRFPCDIKEVFGTKTNSFHIEISDAFPNELNISFKDRSAKPLNVIVKCTKTIDFVIDLVPSNSIHKDLTVISRSQGFIRSQDSKMDQPKVVSSSDSKNRRITFKKLLEESN